MAHQTAVTGYGAEAASYERGRPGYPDELVDLMLAELDVGSDSRVVDLGAGTGKLTRQVVDRVAWVGAVEPVAAMRDLLGEHVPAATPVAAVAEALPLAAGCIDAVVCAQTFHWLDGSVALDELARVLRPGGGLGLIWNTKDESVGWVADVEALIDSVHDARTTPRYKTGRWRSAFTRPSGWQPLTTASVRYAHPVTIDDVVARVLSSSAVGALDRGRRDAIVDDVRSILDRHGMDGTFEMPYVSEIWWTRRTI